VSADDEWADHLVGERIRARRLSLDLTLRQLAARLGNGVTESQISRIEAGKGKPRGATLVCLAKAMRTTAIELATGRRGYCPFCGRGK